jgi:hypothetical protein
MKEKLTKNSGLKLVSLLCAFFVWLAVVNVANPVTTGTKEVPVEPINEQVLEKANLTYEIVGKKTAVITYRIRTKDQYKVKPSDFRAYADLSEMYDVTGAIPVKVEVVNNSDLFETAPTSNHRKSLRFRRKTCRRKNLHWCRIHMENRRTDTSRVKLPCRRITSMSRDLYPRWDKSAE